MISNKEVKVRLKKNYTKHATSDFVQGAIGVVHDWKYFIEVDVKYKYSSLLKIWDWKYYNWLDEYLVKLLNYCDIENFYKNIGWEKSKTILRILKTSKPNQE